MNELQVSVIDSDPLDLDFPSVLDECLQVKSGAELRRIHLVLTVVQIKSGSSCEAFFLLFHLPKSKK